MPNWDSNNIVPTLVALLSWLEIVVEVFFSSMLARLQLSRTSCDLLVTLYETSWGSPPLVLRSTASLLQRFMLPSRFCRALRDVADAVAPAPPQTRWNRRSICRASSEWPAIGSRSLIHVFGRRGTRVRSMSLWRPANERTSRIVLVQNREGVPYFAFE